ncbi:mCG21089, partial [Mus musculus]
YWKNQLLAFVAGHHTQIQNDTVGVDVTTCTALQEDSGHPVPLAGQSPPFSSLKLLPS